MTMEVSSHALDQRRVAGLELRSCRFHEPDPRTPWTITRIWNRTGRPSSDSRSRFVPQGVCAVNDDDSGLVRRGLRRDDVSSDTGWRETAEVRAAQRAAYRGGERMAPGDARGQLAGPAVPCWASSTCHNALAAVSAARGPGHGSGAGAADRLATAPQVPGRMEVLSERPVLVLRDYMHTPDAYTRVLETLAGLAEGGLYIVFGCGGDRDRGKRPVMGRIAARYSDSRCHHHGQSEVGRPVRHLRRHQLAACPPDPTRSFSTGKRRSTLSLREAGPGDVVVSGRERTRNVPGHRRRTDSVRRGGHRERPHGGRSALMAARFTAAEVCQALGLPGDGRIGDFSSVSTDTRDLQPGALFVALQGERFDGTDFVERAERLGAAGAVVNASSDGPVGWLSRVLGARYDRRARQPRPLLPSTMRCASRRGDRVLGKDHREGDAGLRHRIGKARTRHRGQL